MTFCDTTARIGANFRTHTQRTDGRRMEGQTDVEVKIVDTWKYTLRGYILGVLTHTTAWDQH